MDRRNSEPNKFYRLFDKVTGIIRGVDLDLLSKDDNDLYQSLAGDFNRLSADIDDSFDNFLINTFKLKIIIPTNTKETLISCKSLLTTKVSVAKALLHRYPKNRTLSRQVQLYQNKIDLTEKMIDLFNPGSFTTTQDTQIDLIDFSEEVNITIRATTWIIEKGKNIDNIPFEERFQLMDTIYDHLQQLKSVEIKLAHRQKSPNVDTFMTRLIARSKDLEDILRKLPRK